MAVRKSTDSTMTPLEKSASQTATKIPITDKFVYRKALVGQDLGLLYGELTNRKKNVTARI